MSERRSSDPTPPAEGYLGGSPHAYGDYYARDASDATHFREILAILRRHRWLVVGLTAATFGAVAVLAMRQRPVYEARATMQVTEGRLLTAAMDPRGVSSGPVDRTLVQLEVLRSRSILESILDTSPIRVATLTRGHQIGLFDEVRVEPEAEPDTIRLRFTRGGYSATNGDATASARYGEPLVVGGVHVLLGERPPLDGTEVAILSRRAAVERVGERLTVTAREQAGILTVQFSDPDPSFAQAVANAVVAAAEARSAWTAQGETRRRRQFVEEQMVRMDSLHEHAQMQLAAFRQRQQVFSLRDKYAAQQDGSRELLVRRAELDEERRTYRTLLSRLAGGAAENGAALNTLLSSPGLKADPVVSSLSARLLEYQAEKARLTAGEFGSTASNPDVQRMQALIASTTETFVDAVRSHVSTLDARIGALDDLQAEAASQLASLPVTEAEEARLEARVESAGKVADEMRAEYQRARITEAAEVGELAVLDWASQPGAPSGSGRTQKLLLGLVVGLLLGVGGALAVEYMNTSIRDRLDVETALHLPRLAAIPPIGARPRGGVYSAYLAVREKVAPDAEAVELEAAVGRGLSLVTVADLHSSAAEAYRTLRANLLFSPAVDRLTRLVVTSASPGEGKTTTAANLAVTFAQQGLRVLLVDCDLRRPRLHSLFQVKMEPGLAEILHGIVDAPDAVRPTAVRGLSVLACGMLTHNPAELLGGGAMREMLDGLASHFDTVVLDTPPLLVAADAAILGSYADAVVMVVRAGRTERASALEALHQLDATGARIVGAVLNETKAA